MKKSNRVWGDKDIEVTMGNLLRYGVLLTVAIILTGAIIYLSKHGSGSTHYSTFSGEPRRLIEIESILQTALQGRGRSIIQLGLLVLIGTPIARILLSIVGFIIEKDILYSIITFVVLIVIILSLF